MKMSVQTDQVKKTLEDALEEVKWKLPDTPEKFKAYQAVQEAILWLSAPEIFKKDNNGV